MMSKKELKRLKKEYRKKGIPELDNLRDYYNDIYHSTGDHKIELLLIEDELSRKWGIKNAK